MIIKLEFNSLEEHDMYCLAVASRPMARLEAKEDKQLDIQKLANETAKLLEAQEEPKMAQEEAEEVKTEEPASAPEKPQKIDESLRVEVRKMLATLNKMQTGNPAKQLIAATGYTRLTDVPLELLPDLKKAAEEALNNA